MTDNRPNTRARNARALKVLWLIKGLGPGGAEQLLVNQAAATDPLVATIHVAYLVPWKNHHVAVLESLGVTVHALNAPRDLDPRWVLRLRSLLAREHFDVVHTHSPLVAAAVRVAARTVRPRPALVYTEHNRWPRHARSTRAVNRLTFGLDDAQLAVSDDVRSTIAPGHRDRVETLIHGTDLDAVRSAITSRSAVRAELGLTPDCVLVGIVANFRREKAYEVFLDAAAKAIRRNPSLHFVSVGQGPLEGEMRQRLNRMVGDEPALAGRIQLLGYRDDAIRVMSGFDIFTLTSDHEGLPVSLMDALALGLPTVATAVGGIPQAITNDNHGLLVPARDVAGLADAYVRLAEDANLRQRFAAAAAERAAIFDITQATRRLETIYADVSSIPTGRSRR